MRLAEGGCGGTAEVGCGGLVVALIVCSMRSLNLKSTTKIKA